MTLTKRSTKGSALTFTEMDDNLTHLDLYRSVENVTGGGALSTTTGVSLISTTDTEEYTLADGIEGQIKILVMKVDGGNATITPDNLIGWTSIRFNNVHDNVQLLYGSTGWNIIALQNATKIS